MPDSSYWASLATQLPFRDTLRLAVFLASHFQVTHNTSSWEAPHIHQSHTHGNKQARPDGALDGETPPQNPRFAKAVDDCPFIK